MLEKKTEINVLNKQKTNKKVAIAQDYDYHT
jgi:hypothetical protein